MGRGYIVTGGSENTGVLALFTEESAANEYQRELMKRRLNEEGRSGMIKAMTLGDVNASRGRRRKVIDVHPHLPLRNQSAIEIH